MISIVYFTTLSLAGILFAAGVFQFLLILAKVPSYRTTKTIRRLTNRQKSNQGISENSDSILEFIAQFVRINPYKKNLLEEELKVAGIPKTPETFLAGCIFQFLKFAALAVPFLFIFPIISLVFIILAVLKFVQEKQKVSDKIKAKRKQIDLDLPRFVYSIAHELKSNHDVLSIFERHKDGFSPEFGSEIAITIADMRTGNYEAALQRFEGRIGSTSLSEVVRGLIEMTKGNDTHVYWETLALRFSEMQKQALRKEAQKVPPKVRKLSFCLLVCLMIIYGVVLGIQVVSNIGILF